MVKKSINRFYIFGLALMALLYFFGARPNHETLSKQSESVLTEKQNSIHSANPLQQPFEIENKEEQPTTEDDDNEETEDDVASDCPDSVAFLKESSSPVSEEVVSKSQTEHHAPTYVRLRTILI